MNAYGVGLGDRYSRQSDLLPSDLLRKHPIAVIGVGAIGRQAALQLAVIGAGPLTLIDGDLVTSVNLGSHGYLEEDIGKPKVQATAELMAQLNSQVEVVTHFRRFNRDADASEVMFCGVDSGEARGHLFDAAQDKVRFFVDARANGESLRILTACNQRGSQYYAQTLSRAYEAFQGPRNTHTMHYAATIAAGMMVAHFARWLRGLEPPMDIVLKLLADELVVHASSRQPKVDDRVRAQIRQENRCQAG